MALEGQPAGARADIRYVNSGSFIRLAGGPMAPGSMRSGSCYMKRRVCFFALAAVFFSFGILSLFV